MNRDIRQVRSVPTEFNTREDGEKLLIEGYFAVFDSNYEIAPGMSESIRSGAFSDTISGDIRALINHDTTLVLGRTKANTLQRKPFRQGEIDIRQKCGSAQSIEECRKWTAWGQTENQTLPESFQSY